MTAVTGVVLALETTGGTGSVAVAVDGRVRARRFLGDRGRHAAVLPDATAAAVADAGLRWGEVGAVAVGSGPGSFTGVRVAASAANGAAHAIGCLVHPVSSLAAAALTPEVLPAGVGPWPPAASPPPGPRRILFDARGDRLFTAVYVVGPDRFDEVEAPRFARLDEVAAGAGPELLCGRGALRHREALEAAGLQVWPEPAGIPTADGVLAVLARGGGRAPAAPGRWDPDYLRETGAVRARRAR